jgi:hypothetical protein
MRQLIGLSGFCVGIPLLVGWAKWRIWEVRRDRGLD